MESSLHHRIRTHASTVALSLLMAAVGILSSCITEDLPDATRQGTFQACWKALDEHYCFFEE